MMIFILINLTNVFGISLTSNQGFLKHQNQPSILLAEATANGNVSCGGHSASSCEVCPQGNGAAWCNGDCSWDYPSGTCRLPVSCGGHTASSCESCPQGNGAAWCNGDCVWDVQDSTCIKSSEVSCGGHTASSCELCPQGNGAAWCNGDCVWDVQDSTCINPSEQRGEKDDEVDEKADDVTEDDEVDEKANSPVSCGGHYADSCELCPEGNGAAWCNGECVWDVQDATCVNASEQQGEKDAEVDEKDNDVTEDDEVDEKANSPVSCGGHYADSCELCPQGNGAVWCNGDCVWDVQDSTCVNASEQQGEKDAEVDEKDNDVTEKDDEVDESDNDVTEDDEVDEKANSPVSCGGHYADSCELCPQGNGAAWCNGDCVWDEQDSTCVNASVQQGEKDAEVDEKDNDVTEKDDEVEESDNDVTEKDDEVDESDNDVTETDDEVDEKAKSPVSCGGHYADSCELCPQGNGAAWCNGDCMWEDSACIDKPPARDCSACKNSSCCNDVCSWNSKTSLCRDELTNDVRTASVHLNWAERPKGASNPSWWFNQVTVRDSSDVSYFATMGNSFGYGGIQQLTEQPFRGRVLFSIWDQGGCDQDISDCSKDKVAQTVACGTGVTCKGFGGEGTGRKSQFDLNQFPIIGETYYMATQAVPVFDDYGNASRMQYTGYFHGEGGWRLISRIEVTTAGKDWSIHHPYAFVEQWTAWNTLKKRGAAFGPTWMAGDEKDGSDAATATFSQIPYARFSHGTPENHEHVNAYKDEPTGGVAIETGGDIIQEAERGQKFNYDKAVMPDVLVDLDSKRDCLGNATDTKTIEDCLKSV